ncbi:hypothetical protein [Actinomadura mexicana]|uniref:Uncharacterized protein n=1 Tax=Actinomadura mexicana TaxID=134959 RepID=A0A239C4W9_9ACTN|nr:hypothetical protein [Actinomadura mexicana]SNS14464.1 hypothetical protein SAMN06265355_111246 [Actinomadura mexicana]
MESSAEMLRVLADGGAGLSPLNEVNGLDIGLDEAGVLAVRILVSHPEEPLAGLPESLGGLPLIVVYGSPYLETTPVIPDAARHDPVLGGHQVGRHDTHGGLAGTGTLGCVLRDSGTGRPVAISNAHVLGGTPGPLPNAVGDVIQQPTPSSLERLGELLRWEASVEPAFSIVPQLDGLGGAFDAAVCSITDRGAKVGEIEGLGTVAGFASVRLGERVHKRGARTLRPRAGSAESRGRTTARATCCGGRSDRSLSTSTFGLPARTPTASGRTPATPAQWWSTRTTRSSACTTRAMAPPVTPVTSRRWRPRSERFVR